MPEISLTKDELCILLQKKLALKMVVRESEIKEKKGYGEAIAISALLQCKVFIKLVFQIANLSQQKKAPEITKAERKRFFLEFTTAHPLPELLKQDELQAFTYLSSDEAIKLQRLQERDPSKQPTAEDILTGSVRLGRLPELNNLLQKYMNHLLTHLFNQYCVNSTSTFFLIEHPEAMHYQTKGPFTQPFFFNPDNVVHTLTCYSAKQFAEMLASIKSHANTPLNLPTVAKKEKTSSCSSLLNWSFFIGGALLAAGLTQALTSPEKGSTP